MRTRPALAVAAALVVALGAPGGAVAAQQVQAPPTPRALSPIDLTGTWVSVVTEDWRFRMVTPPKGDYSSLPINAEGRKVADAWDPAKDEAAGDACKSYAAPALMRVPGRARIAWQDDNTLKIEYDAGQQTRLLRFGDVKPSVSGDAGWQGLSAASWEFAGPQGRRAPGGPRGGHGGSLKVVTTNIRPGYLRKNGVPYSRKATVTEFFDRHRALNGDEWFTVTTIVNDPTYLESEFITSTDFKKEPSDAKWRPTPCAVR